MSLALGPVVGGVLVGLGDWRTVFWFNLALGVVLLGAALRYVPDSADPQQGRLDIAGFVLGSVLLGTLIYAGITGETAGYASPGIVALFALSGCSLIAFVIVERRARSPMLNLRYVADPAVAGALFVAFAAYFGVFSIFFLTALYLDVVEGYGGAAMAGVFAPMAVAIALGSIASGRWVARAGVRTPMITGCMVSAGGIVMARYVLVPDPSYPRLAAVLAVAGVGFGLAVVPLTAAVLGHVPAAFSGMAASATNTARQLGSVVGVAALGAIVNAHLQSDFGANLDQSGVGATTKDFVLGLLETGGSAAAGLDIANPPPAIAPLVNAATAAFRSGLHVALLVSAALIVLSGLVIALVPRTALAADAEVH